MNENYIVINGKKIELTEEQLKQLGIETEKKRKNPFEIVERGEDYFYVNRYGDINNSRQGDDSEDDCLFQAANYFNDESFAEQVALHQLLYRKLLKFAYDNGFEDNQAWNKTNCHYYIGYNTDEGRFYADVTGTFKHNDVWFCSRDSANRAIREVVKPFMKEHPDFVW